MVDNPSQIEFGGFSLCRRQGIQPGIRGAVEEPFPLRYPQELEQWFNLRSGRRVLLRPYRSGDEKAYRDLFSKLTPKDIWFRYFSYLKDAPEYELNKFRDINYAADLIFVANAVGRSKVPETIGVIGLSCDAKRSIAEFALIVRTDQKRQGLGKIMLGKMIGYARCQGYQLLVADVLKTNFAMLNMSVNLGFEQHHIPGDEEVTICLNLSEAQHRGQHLP
jgi:acetyltransferase